MRIAFVRTPSCLLAAVAMLPLVPGRGTAQPGRPGDRDVPQFVLDVARQGSLRQLGEALAAATIPAGVVVGRDEWNASPPMGFDFARQAPLPLSVVLAEIQHRHVGYRARVRAGGEFIIEPRRDSACARSLRHAMPSFEASGTVVEILDRLRKRLDPRAPEGPPGVVWGGAGSEAAELAGTDAYRRTVSLALMGPTLEDIFFEVVRQAPGIVWGVHEVPESPTGVVKCEFHYYSGRSTVFTGWTLPR